MILQHNLLLDALGWIEVIFFLGVALILIVLLIIGFIALIDASQHRDAIRHNYPFIGRFRHWFLHLGVFFRAYFLSEDRQELPFNRLDRNWVYRVAANKSTMAAFGSTRHLREPGTIMFANSAFPPIDHSPLISHVKPSTITFGPYCQHPYTTDKFFHVSAMSFGALSAPAIQALSHGAGMANILLDSGEGGISPYHLEGNCDLVAEIGTAKYGYRTLDGQLDDDKLTKVASLEQVKMFAIKLSQGAKPGQGGVLPAIKITAEIARIRGIPTGQDSISPNRWPEIGNVAELLTMIDHIRSVTGKPTGFKFVMGHSDWLEEMCRLIHQLGIQSAPDFIIVDSSDGGTGAGPLGLMDYVGLPISLSLPKLVNILIHYRLRDRIKIGCSGKLIRAGKVAWALAMGADYINSARGFMFSIGCIQAMRCHKDTCPTGITTHRLHLQAGLDPAIKKVKVMNYANNMHKEVGVIAHSCGVDDPRQLKRHHVHIIQANGQTISATEQWPTPTTVQSSKTK